MLGSSNSISCANIMLNGAVAESLRQYADELENANDFTGALHELIRRVVRMHKRIIFNGNGYDEAWIREASEVRGLHNLRTTPDALPAILEEKNAGMLIRHNIFSREEIRSRYEITLENYCKTVNIEGLTMTDMVHRDILPAIGAYIKELSETLATKRAAGICAPGKGENAHLARLCSLQEEIYSATESLEESLVRLKEAGDITKESCFIRDNILPRMATLRVACDEAETLTARKYWPFPTYADLLFGVR